MSETEYRDPVAPFRAPLAHVSFICGSFIGRVGIEHRAELVPEIGFLRHQRFHLLRERAELLL